MNRESLQYYKDKLEKMQASLFKNCDDASYRQDIKESSGELSSYDNHPADLAGYIFEREKEAGVQDNEKVILGKVTRALQVINENKKNTGNVGIVERILIGNALKLSPILFTAGIVLLKNMLIEKLKMPIDRYQKKFWGIFLQQLLMIPWFMMGRIHLKI